MRLLCMILLLAAISSVNRAQAKKSVPLWVRWERYQEEIGWQRTSNAFNALDALEPDPQDVEYLAIAIYCEAGADSISDETRYMVGDVILNRVEDERFPDTIYDVLTQRAQYGRFYWTGIIWPARAENASEAHAVARAREIARSLLKGEHTELYGAGYIWQAEFRQGSEQIYSDGIYFGR